MTDESVRKKVIQPNIRFIGFKGRECLCKNGTFAHFVDSILYELKEKRNNLLQLDAFISVGVIQYNNKTTTTHVCIAINDIYWKKRANYPHSLLLICDD